LIHLTYSQKSKKQLRFQNHLFTMKQSLFLTLPEVLMMSRFSSFVLAFLLLVASGQASAATLVSASATITDFTTLTNWSTATTCGGTVANPSTIAAGTDTFTICAGHTLTLAAPAVDVKGLTVAGTLNIGAQTLTATGAVDTTGSGTITIGAGGQLVGTALTTAGTGNVTGTGTAKLTLSGALTVGAGTTVAVGTGGVFTSVTAPTMAGTITIAAGGELKGSTLALTGSGVVTGTGTGKITLSGAYSGAAGTTTTIGVGGVLETTAVTLVGTGKIDGQGTVYVTTTGTIDFGASSGFPGTLKLADAAYTITPGANMTIGTLDTSALTGSATPKALATGATAFLVTITNLIPSGTKDAVVKITVGTSGTLTITNAPAGATCESDAANAGTFAATAFPVTTLAAGRAVKCTTSAVPAPFFSTKEKPTVFSEELKH
jgi:hypothetical protein